MACIHFDDGTKDKVSDTGSLLNLKLEDVPEKDLLGSAASESASITKDELNILSDVMDQNVKILTSHKHAAGASSDSKDTWLLRENYLSAQQDYFFSKHAGRRLDEDVMANGKVLLRIFNKSTNLMDITYESLDFVTKTEVAKVLGIEKPKWSETFSDGEGVKPPANISDKERQKEAKITAEAKANFFAKEGETKGHVQILSKSSYMSGSLAA